MRRLGRRTVFCSLAGSALLAAGCSGGDDEAAAKEIFDDSELNVVGV